ncbi:hypothetical protein GCM10023081_00300 [Arthrobacter ginkgonis]|uniref:Uncharacterized protein n=1 Tax=Arthrobacter ginkgonis TaxID=1630594 RepID=A0ABP7BPV6_9MICC
MDHVVNFPLVAIEEDGRVHFLADPPALAEVEELFVHGEIDLVMDLAGERYEYEYGDARDMALHRSGPGDVTALTRTVWDRFFHLSQSQHKHALRASQSVNPEVVARIRAAPNPDLIQAFLMRPGTRLTAIILDHRSRAVRSTRVTRDDKWRRSGGAICHLGDAVVPRLIAR